MSRLIQLSEEFTLINCYACGVPFAIPQEMDRVLRETHRDFFCPSGHRQAYVKETEADRLRKELLDERQRRAAEANLLRDQIAEQEGARRKLEKRLTAGVCPCCTRTFANVARHMKSKHPDVPARIPAAASKRIQ